MSRDKMSPDKMSLLKMPRDKMSPDKNVSYGNLSPGKNITLVPTALC
jgi:hypothetical protein